MVFWLRRTLKPKETKKFIEKIQAFFERYFGLWKTWCIFTPKKLPQDKKNDYSWPVLHNGAPRTHRCAEPTVISSDRRESRHLLNISILSRFLRALRLVEMTKGRGVWSG